MILPYGTSRNKVKFPLEEHNFNTGLKKTYRLIYKEHELIDKIENPKRKQALRIGVVRKNRIRLANISEKVLDTIIFQKNKRELVELKKLIAEIKHQQAGQISD